MERLQFRSTSTIALMAELREADLRAEAHRHAIGRRPPTRKRALAFGLRLLSRMGA